MKKLIGHWLVLSLYMGTTFGYDPSLYTTMGAKRAAPARTAKVKKPLTKKQLGKKIAALDSKIKTEKNPIKLKKLQEEKANYERELQARKERK